MSTAEVLQLPLREKLQLMEVLWEDMRERAERAEIPDDQKKLLDKRRADAEAGKSKILDWEEVKNTIGRA